MTAPLEALHRLFPEADYRMAMNLRALDAGAFMAPSQEPGLLDLRRQLLAEAPEFYAAALPGTDLGLLAGLAGGKTALLDIGSALEPDVVLLQPDGPGTWRVVAGCVCFPTMWSLPEKLGLPLAAVHEPVPGLNAQLGPRIDQFLGRIPVEAAYGRENWGLSATNQLDQHPRHHLAAIPAGAALAEVWLRVEEQALLRLDSRTILFGIRIANYRLDAVAADRLLAPRLALALETMAEKLAAYKRITACRKPLADKLRAAN